MRTMLSVAAISFIALIVLMSGCTSGPAGQPSATPMPMDMPMGPSTPAATADPVSGQGIMPATLFDQARFAWYQYKITSGTMGMPMIHTYRYEDVTYAGTEARHANITMDMLPELLIYLDIWSDAADNHTINVHEIAYENGRLTKDADIDAANFTKWEGADLASPKFPAAPLQSAGTETVTVGGKTYTAAEYAGTAGEQRYTYWVSQDVPVPVKLLVHDAKGDTAYELAGWG